MANRFYTPFPSFRDDTGEPLVGAKLFFYAAGTSTKLATYSDDDLTTPNTNPIVLDANGQSATAIFLQNLAYKVVFAPAADTDPPTSPYWTADNVWASDYSTSARFFPVNGNPNGVVAGTAGSVGVPADVLWDFANGILYVCTTTGDAAGAVWTAINASTSTGALIQPQGYLTPTSGTPVIFNEVIGGTAVYYALDQGNQVPIYNGSTMSMQTFSELTLALASQHAINTIYDVFIFNNAGVPTLVTGPAWSSSTAGSSARGTGAGTTELARLNGLYVNAVQISGRNGATTYTVEANMATYLGTIMIDATAGQITCHRTFGQSRKWGVWNAYNRKSLILQMGDGVSSWTYGTAVFRQSRADPLNTILFLAGLGEEIVEVEFHQTINLSTVGALLSAEIAIGFNSTVTSGGKTGNVASLINGVSGTHVFSAVAKCPALLFGFHNINALERGNAAGGTATYIGSSSGMLVEARWRG